jgi:hypothetical protein
VAPKETENHTPHGARRGVRQKLEDAYQEGLPFGLRGQEAFFAAAHHILDGRTLANELVHPGVGQAKKAQDPLSASTARREPRSPLHHDVAYTIEYGADTGSAN